MEPSPKRPRLSVFEHNATDVELDNARYHNDLTLKGRFESIFEKYAQDFTGIGDEIDILTGDVIVNNGHLESMTTETDPGLNNVPGGFTSAGRSMLRAMTVTLNPDLPGPDDVLMSIETIAENAALAEDSSTAESEDDNLVSSRPSRESTSKSTTNGMNDGNPEASLEPYNSDSDSLFDDDRARSPSVDSLFADPPLNEERSAGYNRQSCSVADAFPHPTTFGYIDDDDDELMEDNEDQEILAKYGTYMGKEVLNLIGQRRDAHIEPAWRIPVQLKPAPVQRSVPRISIASSTDSRPNSRQKTSLWKAPNPTRKRTLEDESDRESREESIDPLQEDTDDDREDLQERDKANDTDESDLEFQPEPDPNQDMMARISSTGICPYCNVSFGTKSSVMAHWDRLLNSNAKRAKPGDPHDYSVIGPMRSSTVFRVRDPRLVVYDYRTMVELHEGAGLSFDDIAESKTLRTRKSGLQLQEIYNKHRTPPEHKDPSIGLKPWTEAEESILQDMCKNPLSTMTTLRRRLKKHSDLEIGNHLAGIWLSQLRAANPQAMLAEQMSSRSDRSRPAAEDSSRANLTHVNQPEFVTIKEEDSGDELFGA